MHYIHPTHPDPIHKTWTDLAVTPLEEMTREGNGLAEAASGTVDSILRMPSITPCRCRCGSKSREEEEEGPPPAAAAAAAPRRRSKGEGIFVMQKKAGGPSSPCVQNRPRLLSLPVCGAWLCLRCVVQSVKAKDTYALSGCCWCVPQWGWGNARSDDV